MTENSEHHSTDDILEKEARLFARYLIDSEPPPEMVNRYIDANRKLGLDTVINFDAKRMQFLLAHPWSVPFLDAATGFLQPDASLRKKIYTMAAILEASREYTDHFFPQSLSPLKLIVNIIVNGLTAGIKIMIGIPIFYFLRKYNND